MRELIEFIAKAVVDNPGAVEVTQVRGSQMVVVKLRVAPEDKGWVIGRHGRVANAMRTMLRVAVAAKAPGRRAILEIV